ncbi:MAG: ABC transporter ATP-binding protein [Chloroflexi bacterium]|nr:ABC transporter ATP-binding protein [Chloroflexota bacterium]
MIHINNVVANYTTVRGTVTAVDHVSIQIPHGVTLGIAGESGCGKSTLLKVLYGDIGYPLSIQSGSIEYGMVGDRNEEITTSNIKKYWFKHIAYVPQGSMSSLNPVLRIRSQFLDYIGPGVDKNRMLEEVREYVKALGLPPESIDAYPHQLSGGMRQRIMVAMASFLKPRIILADEPTTALDVVVQKGILLMLMDLQEQLQNTILFVSHDMGVHYQISHKMFIMYAAKGVEYGDSKDVFERPLHPYTRLLIESLPAIGDTNLRKGVAGRPPSLWEKLVGCRFAPRCPFAVDRCASEEPALTEYRPNHFAACHLAERFL